MEKYYPYNCAQCGNCCRHVDLIEEMCQFDRGDGVCKYLLSNNKCAIYENRPNLCNGEYVYYRYYKNISVDEYHEIIKSYCNAIRGGGLEGLYKD